MKEENVTVDRVYRYQMSLRLILFGLSFTTFIFFWFAYMAFTSTNSRMLVQHLFFSGVGLFFVVIYVINAAWTATGGRKIILSNGTVEIPPWFSRAPRSFPFQQIEHLQLKIGGGRLECVGLNANGNKLFRVDSWQFKSDAEFVDFVTQMQSRGGIAVKQ